jgi:hypothetical protein
MDAESMASFEKLNDDDDDDNAEVFVSSFSLVLPFGVVSSLWGNADETNNALNRLVVVEVFVAALRKEEEEEEEEEEDANLDANEREEYAFMPVDASIVCVCVCFGYESVT